MINLAEGIEERAIERTTKEVTEGIVINMYGKAYTLEQISEVTKLDINDVKKIIDNRVH